MPVAYNPSDPEQRALLSAISKGEVGAKPASAFIGNGGADLSGAVVDQWGFPQWAGMGNSHAAGLFQFQPGTWDQVASKYGLNFQNPQDQAAGAWYLAQEVYQRKTGLELDDQLDKGNFGSIQSALQSTWTSANGNAAIPEGLAATIIAGLHSGDIDAPWEVAAGGTATSSGGTKGILGQAEDFFVRFGLIIVGTLIIGVALWMLLSNQGIVPSPSKVAKLAAVAL